MSQSDLATYALILNRWKKFIGILVGFVAVVSIVISFFLPKWYKARSTLIPSQSSEITAGISALIQGLSLPGIGNVRPVDSETQLLMAVLDSQTLREKLIRDFELQRIYKARTMDDALRAQRNLATIGLTDQGTVEVLVEDKDPERAARIANTWVQLLDDFNKNARMTAGKKTRLFVEKRLEETLKSLRHAEDTLAAYQQTHGSAPLSGDASSAVDATASLLARRMALQVQVNYLSDLFRDNAPQLIQARAELQALDRQIDTLPPLAMDFARLLRDLKIQEQVYALLVGQLEEAKINEVKDIPTIEILDQATAPQRRSRPIRWLFCTSLTLGALLSGLVIAFVLEFRSHLMRAGREERPANRDGTIGLT